MEPALKIKSVSVIPLRIPFTDGGTGVGLMPSRWTHLDMALVRVETSDGLIGWGEGFAYSCLRATCAAIDDMVGPLVVGREVTDIPALNLELQQKLHLHGRYGITMFAISGVDIALWDLAGKAAGKPLGSLLGGRTRERIPAYASLVRYAEPKLVRRFAEETVELGFADVKLHEIALPAIEAGRMGVGPAIRLTTDVNCNWSRTEAETLMAHMQRLDLYWVEEPLFPPDDADALADLEARFSVSIASGENACTSVEFARTIPKIAYAQPSVTKVGGVSEFMRVAALAKTAGKTLMPHSPYFGPGYWATLHLESALAHTGLLEHLWIKPDAYLSEAIPLPVRGFVTVPDAPGLGCVPDPAVIARYRVA